MEPNRSPSGVSESEVLTGVSPANRAARQSQGEGMQGLSEALREKQRGKISFHTKAEKRSCTKAEALSWRGVFGQGVCPHCPPKWFNKSP